MTPNSYNDRWLKRIIIPSLMKLLLNASKRQYPHLPTLTGSLDLQIAWVFSGLPNPFTSWFMKILSLQTTSIFVIGRHEPCVKYGFSLDEHRTWSCHVGPVGLDRHAFHRWIAAGRDVYKCRAFLSTWNSSQQNAVHMFLKQTSGFPGTE